VWQSTEFRVLDAGEGGEWATFIRLLQMVVIPFIAVSLIAGIGKLGYREARDLALKGGGVLLVLWGIALLFVTALPLAFPAWESASFFSTSLVAEREPFDFLGLYIPRNPLPDEEIAIAGQQRAAR